MQKYDKKAINIFQNLGQLFFVTYLLKNALPSKVYEKIGEEYNKKIVQLNQKYGNLPAKNITLKNEYNEFM